MPRRVCRSLVPAFAVLALAAAPLAASPRTGDDGQRGFEGGSAVAMRGLQVGGGLTTNLGFVNLAAAANRCSLSVVGDDGKTLLPATTWTLRAFEERPFLDLFEGLEAFAGREATATVSCERAYSTFAVLADGSGETMRTVAAEKLSGAPAATAQAPLAPKAGACNASLAAKAAAACSAGALCFDAEGVVHEPGPPPGPPTPVGRVAFAAPAGRATRLVMSLDVKIGPWFPQEPDGKHLIYWFVVNKNIDMPGLLYFRGPGKYEAFARHGVGLKHPQKIKVIKKWKAEVGRVYHVVNDYDMEHSHYTVTISDAQTGEVLVVLTSRPNVASYNIKGGSKFIVDMGFFPGLVPTEVPSYGWRYSNVHVEAFVGR